MVTYRFSFPEPRVRVLALHLFLLLVVLFSVGGCVRFAVAAEADELEYYIYSDEASAPVKAARALSYYNTLPYSIWDAPTKVTNDTDYVKVGGYTIRSTSTPLDVVRAAAMLAINNTTYTDNAVASISANLSPIQSLLTTYLPRIDTNTDSLHGDLLNIQNALGWTGTGSTVLDWLRLIRMDTANINLVNQTLAAFRGDVITGFGGVTTRQDAFDQLFSLDGTFDVAFFGGSSIDVASVSSFSEALYFLSYTLVNNLVLYKDWTYILGPDGNLRQIDNDYPLSALLNSGIRGLSSNLVGYGDGSTSMSFLRSVSGGGLSVVTSTTNNILDALGLLGTELQNPLAKLQYVWADDDDIKIADANQPVKDEVVKDFVGGGDAAVSVGNISDIAGASSSAVSAFSGAGKVSDIFVPLNDGNNYEFWSQATADQIDTVNQPAPAAEAPPYDPAADERYVIDDDGMVHLADSAFSDVYAYLEEASK